MRFCLPFSDEFSWTAGSCAHHRPYGAQRYCNKREKKVAIKGMQYFPLHFLHQIVSNWTIHHVKLLVLLNSNPKLLIKLSNIKQKGAAITEYLRLHAVHHHDEKSIFFLLTATLVMNQDMKHEHKALYKLHKQKFASSRGSPWRGSLHRLLEDPGTKTHMRKKH